MLFEIQLTFRQIDWINGQNVLNGGKKLVSSNIHCIYIIHPIFDYNSIIRHKFEEMGTFGTYFSFRINARVE